MTEPSPWWQATGLLRGAECVIRWEHGIWTCQGGDAAVLPHFLDGMDAAGYDGGPEMGLPPAIGHWEGAAEASARAALPGPVAIETNFSDCWVPGRVY